jgi:hypothetical protein
MFAQLSQARRKIRFVESGKTARITTRQSYEQKPHDCLRMHHMEGDIKDF